jgi:hypothetical protein
MVCTRCSACIVYLPSICALIAAAEKDEEEEEEEEEEGSDESI